MKNEINTILRHLDTQDDERITRLRDWILQLDESRQEELHRAGIKLLNETRQVNTQDHPRLGFYCLFLGCVYYEQGNVAEAIHGLQNAVNELSGSEINKSITHWLLGLIYRDTKDFPRATDELQKAIHLLATNININTLRINSESSKRQKIKIEINKVLDQLATESIFGTTPPITAQNPETSPTENETQDTESTNGKTATESTATSSEAKARGKENFTYQETHTGGNVSFQFIQTITPESIPSFQSTSTGRSTESNIENNKTSPIEETRTDGYLSLQSLPIYEQKVAAGKSGKPEIGLNKTGVAEARIIFLNNQPHDVYPLKRTSNEIKIASNETNWGWVKVVGHSMNNIANKTSIKNGDFILILFTRGADENDIVLASFEDPQTTQSFLTVKRYRKDQQILKSESTEKGDEYNDIHIGDKNNAKILGVIYAVAKPFDAY